MTDDYTTGGDIEPVPDMRADTEPDFYQVVGVTAFALAMRDESYIVSFIERVQEHGYNTIRVLSKTDGWAGPPQWLPEGPPSGGGAESNLKSLLRIASQYPNFWVEVVACATERDDHRECIAWSRKVARICAEYQNVFISAMNEPQMSNWSTGELNELMGILRNGSGRYVGVDQPAEGGHYRFNPQLRVDFKAMHPKRNPGLNIHELRNVVNINGTVLFDETTCYVSEWEADTWGLHNNNLFYLNGNGTEAQRKEAAIEAMGVYKKVRDARWYFHSIALIMCDRLDFWLPRWR